MPKKNLVKRYSAHTSYHVYIHGHRRQTVFADRRDVNAFIGRLRELLLRGTLPQSGVSAVLDVELLAYALVPNHVHMLIHQRADTGAIPRMMRSLIAPYARRFNDRYGRAGSVWEDYYKARRVSAGEDRMEMVTYIHLNRDGNARSVFTSHPDYLGERVQPWLNVERGLRPFGGSEGYREFISDRERIRAARRRARLLDY